MFTVSDDTVEIDPEKVWPSPNRIIDLWQKPSYLNLNKQDEVEWLLESLFPIIYKTKILFKIPLSIKIVFVLIFCVYKTTKSE